MVYLDYSATTPVNKEVLDSFNKVCIDYQGNANSLHELGTKSSELIKYSVKQIANLLNVYEDEIIFTSGASEANNLAVIGSILKHKSRGKHIITTKLEHSSIINTMEFLEREGYTIDYVNILENGKVDINDLLNKITNDTCLVSICHVNSEIGIIQDVNEIGLLLKKYPKIIFHVDGTQAIGKINVDLSNIDLYSMSGHKIYGLVGVGVLIKKRGIELEPIIHGGKSQSIYRSGTPTTALYVSFAKALRLILNDNINKYNHVLELNNYLRDNIKDIEDIYINSNCDTCIPHILNISIKGIKPETMLHALSDKEIYISTKTACSDDESMSQSVLELTKNKDLAKTSIRISISYLTKKEEIDYFINTFKELVNKLRIK